jgi:hypothetical protein
MSKFVDACAKEWKRLGVPESASNEMAADLAADLAEAEAEGVSPEEVLGNGVFDPKSFAASWAIARGFARRIPRGFGTTRRPRWTVALSAAASVLALLLGLLILVGTGVQRSAVVQIVQRSVKALGRGRIFITPHRVILPGPPFIGPGGRVFIAPPPPFHLLGWILLLVGLIGIGVTLWLWKPWSTRRRDTGTDGNVCLPSYL